MALESPRSDPQQQLDSALKNLALKEDFLVSNVGGRPIEQLTNALGLKGATKKEFITYIAKRDLDNFFGTDPSREKQLWTDCTVKDGQIIFFANSTRADGTLSRTQVGVMGNFLPPEYQRLVDEKVKRVKEETRTIEPLPTAVARQELTKLKKTVERQKALHIRDFTLVTDGEYEIGSLERPARIVPSGKDFHEKTNAARILVTERALRGENSTTRAARWDDAKRQYIYEVDYWGAPNEKVRFLNNRHYSIIVAK